MKKIPLWKKGMYILAGLLAALLIFLAYCHIADRNRWPAPPEGFTPPAVTELTAGDPASSNAWFELASILPKKDMPQKPTKALLDEFARFCADEPMKRAVTNDYPELSKNAAWLLACEPAWMRASEMRLFLQPDGLAAGGVERKSRTLFNCVTTARLSYFHNSGRIRNGEFEKAAESWIASLKNSRLIVQNSGVEGLYASTFMTTGIARNIIAAAIERDIPDEIMTRLAQALEEAELPPSVLPEAIIYDAEVARAALRSFFVPKDEVDEPEIAATHPSRANIWMVRRFGSDEAKSMERLDAIVNWALKNAQEPFREVSLFDGLPGWLNHRGRPPWGSDPFAAVAASAFINQVYVSGIYVPTRNAELRAARIVLSLARRRRLSEDNAWPDGLDASELAISDPFSPDGAPYRYRLNESGAFTLYSIGSDQVDDGGVLKQQPGGRSSEPAAMDLIYGEVL